MPKDTPSPHRFLAPPTAAATPRLNPKPQSGLRNVLVAPTHKSAGAAPHAADLQFKKLTPAKRFVIAPTRPKQITQGQDTLQDKHGGAFLDIQAQNPPRAKPRRKFERVESIEEGSQSSTAGTQVENHTNGILPSIEHVALFPNESHSENEEDHNPNEEMLFELPTPNKRRRISPPSSPSHNHPQTAPQTPIPTHNPTTHRFKVPSPRTPGLFGATTSSSTTAAPPSHRPHFILPPHPTSPPKPAKPLPEIFSPSRKNGKYVHGGLAATVTSWIIETANTGFAAQERSGSIQWGREKDDGVRLRVQVRKVGAGSMHGSSSGETQREDTEVECFAGGVVFVRGDTEPGLYNASRGGSVAVEDGEVKVLLAGQGGARGSGGVRVRTGCVVGVRAPMWDVDIGGETWVVGVDWVLLS